MFRTVVVGLGALILAGCGPGDQTPAAERAAPEPALTPAAPASAPRPAAAMSWEAMQDHYRSMEVEPTDPLEALEHRAVACAHFSGEVGSEDPERERYLNAQVDKYGCEGALVAEVRAMRDARSDEPVAVRRLDTILANLY